LTFHPRFAIIRAVVKRKNDDFRRRAALIIAIYPPFFARLAIVSYILMWRYEAFTGLREK